MPVVCESQWNCCDMGRMAMLMLTLSMLHSMNARKQSATIVHRRLHRGCAVVTCTCVCTQF